MNNTHRITAEWEDGYTFEFYIQSELDRIETEQRINQLMNQFEPESNLELLDIIEKETDEVIRATNLNEINLNL